MKLIVPPAVRAWRFSGRWIEWEAGSQAVALLERRIHLRPLGASIPIGSVGFGAEHRFPSTCLSLTLSKIKKLRPKTGGRFSVVPRLVKWQSWWLLSTRLVLFALK